MWASSGTRMGVGNEAGKGADVGRKGLKGGAGHRRGGPPVPGGSQLLLLIQGACDSASGVRERKEARRSEPGIPGVALVQDCSERGRGSEAARAGAAVEVQRERAVGAEGVSAG